MEGADNKLAGEQTLRPRLLGERRWKKKKKSRGSHEEVGGVAEFFIYLFIFFWLLLYSNDHLDKGMVEETALHSINWAFVVTELLMMYKRSSAALSWTMRALCL